MAESFSHLVRAAEGPYVSVEIDDVVGTGGLIAGTVAVVASWLRILGGPYRVRVGVNRGARLDIVDHGYRSADAAADVAVRLVGEITTIGLSAIADWDRDPAHWQI